MNHVTLLALLISLAVAIEDDDGFEAFKQKHNRKYKDEHEHNMRRGHYKIAKALVDKHNAEAAANGHQFALGINKFADWTPEEKQQLLPKIARQTGGHTTRQPTTWEPSTRHTRTTAQPTWEPPTRESPTWQPTQSSTWQPSSTRRTTWQPTQSSTWQPSTTRRTTWQPTSSTRHGPTTTQPTAGPTTAPTGPTSAPGTGYKDFTTTGLVPPVRNQGNCGDCWTFSAADCAAYYYAVANGLSSSVTLSTQELTDCALAYAGQSPDGCQGGSADEAFDYIQHKKIDPESAYPFVSGTTGQYSGSCHQDSSAAISVWTDTAVTATATAGGNTNDESAMGAYLGAVGPAVVYIYADCDQFMYYTSGLIHDICSQNQCTVNGAATSCSSTDHAVLAVGYLYNSSLSTPYYRIKNSWNTDWGENGFVNIQALTNELNIAQSGAMYPVGIGAGSG